jgi:hypothetical protein
MAKRKKPNNRFPEIGEDVYIPTSMYIDHGEDDFAGGLCEVTRVELAGKGFSLAVKERRGWIYSFRSARDFWSEQASLKKEYGQQRGRPDPDYGWTQ